MSEKMMRLLCHTNSPSQAERDIPINQQNFNKHSKNCNSGEKTTVNKHFFISGNEQGCERSTSVPTSTLTVNLTMCSSSQTSSQELSTEAYHKTKIHKCSVCEKACETWSKLRIHQLMHSDERFFPCEVCTKTFKFKSGLNRHMRKRHSIRTSSDHNTTCGEWQGQEQLLPVKEDVDIIPLDHMERFEKAKIYKCPECEMIFRKPSKLVDHKRKHSDERAFSCKICAKSFKYKNGLTRHMREQHSQRQIAPSMVLVEREEHRNGLSLEFNASRTESLEEIENNLIGENLPQEQNGSKMQEISQFCEERVEDVESDIGFNSEATDISSKHFLHSGQRDMSYHETCKYEENSLEKKIEFDEMENKQDTSLFCEESFKEVENDFKLNSGPNGISSKHFPNAKLPVKRYKKAKIYTCSDCGKVFHKPSALLTHKRKHSDERMFTCKICGKTFKYKGGLTRHLKEQHGGATKYTSKTAVDCSPSEKMEFLCGNEQDGKICENEANNPFEESLNCEQSNVGIDGKTLEYKGDNSPFCKESFEKVENYFELNSGSSNIPSKHFINCNERGLGKLEICKYEGNSSEEDFECDEMENKQDTSLFCEENFKEVENDFKLNSGPSGISSKHFPNAKLPVKRYKKAKIYKCSDCGKVFHKPSALLTHKRKHSDERMFTCEICGKTFKYKGGLTAHLKEQHGGATKYPSQTAVDCSTSGKMEFLCGKEQDGKICENEANNPFEESLNCEQSNVGIDGKTSEYKGDNSPFCKESFEKVENYFELNSGSSNIPSKHFIDCNERGLGKLEIFKYEGNSSEEDFECDEMENKQDTSLFCEESFKEVENDFKLNSGPNGISSKHFPSAKLPVKRYKKAKIYTCSYCGKVFHKPSALLTHKRKHSDERMFTCEICGKTFKYKGGLTRHLKEQHGRATKYTSKTAVDCSPSEKMDFLFVNEQEGKICENEANNSFEESLNCEQSNVGIDGKTLEYKGDNSPFCKESFEKVENYFELNSGSSNIPSKHSIDCNKRGLGKLEICKYEGNSSEEDFECDEIENKQYNFLLYRERFEKVENDFELNSEPNDISDKHFPNDKLPVLFKRCKKAKFYKCSDCDKVFHKPSALTTHKRKHSDERLFTCEICRKSFKYKGGVTRHLKEKHGLTTSNHLNMVVDCSPLGKMNSNEQESKSWGYEASNHGGENLNCEQSNVETDGRNLERKEGNSELCEEVLEDDVNCEQNPNPSRFFNETVFNDMFSIPTERFEKVKLHKCPSCEKVFLQRSKLLIHQRKHSDQRLFTCEICKKKFKHKWGQTRHMKKRHGQRGNNINVVGSKAARSEESSSQKMTPTNLKENFASEKENCKHEKGSRGEENSKQVHRNFEENLENKTDYSDFCEGNVSDVENNVEPNPEQCQVLNEQFLNVIKASPAYKRKKPKLYKCTDCEKDFRRPSALLTHKRKHSDERSFSCNICPISFKHKWGLNRHMKKQHGQEKMCQNDERQVNENGLSWQDEVHYVNTFIESNITETYKYEENNSVEEHFRQGLENDDRCSENKKVNSEFYEESSKEVEDNHNSGQCELPTENLPDATLLDLIQRCKKAKFYKCPECGKVCRKSSALQSHQRKHSDQRLFACDICGKSFKHKGGLARHLKERHGQERNRQSVMVDRRQENANSSSLQGQDDQQIKVNSFESVANEDTRDDYKERTFKNCVQEECNSEMKEVSLKLKQDKFDDGSLEDVSFHIFGKQTAYKCPECPRAFLTLSELREHQYKHVDFKSFPCKLCSKAFKFRSGLRRHNRKEHKNGLKKLQNYDKICNVESQMLESVGEEMLERLESGNSSEEMNENVDENLVNQDDVAENLPSKSDQSCSFSTTTIDGEPALVKVFTKIVHENSSMKKPPALYNCNKCEAKFKELCDFLTHQRIHK